MRTNIRYGWLNSKGDWKTFQRGQEKTYTEAGKQAIYRSFHIPNDMIQNLFRRIHVFSQDPMPRIVDVKLYDVVYNLDKQKTFCI